MPLPVVAISLPFAVLIAVVVVWPRRHATRSSARLLAEAIGWMVLSLAGFYGAVMLLQWMTARG